MKKYLSIASLLIMVLLITEKKGIAQSKPYSLTDCIETAWQSSTEIGRVHLGLESSKSNLDYSKSARNPNLVLSGNGSIFSNNQYDTTSEAWDRSSNTTASMQLSSSVTIYNGAKLKNAIAQNKVNVEAAESEIQTQRELLGLEILSAYMNVLYAQEQAKNNQSQLESSEKQLVYIQERRKAGVVAQSELLNMQSQVAVDKANAINAESQVRLLKVALMQLMNTPVVDDFSIQAIDSQLQTMVTAEQNTSEIYAKALTLQPSIQTADLDLQSAEYDIKMAKADALPELSLNGSVGTSYYGSDNALSFGTQTKNQINPSIGLSLSVPIYQRGTFKNKVQQSRIQYQQVELQLIDLKNNLRKAIEQVVIDTEVAKANLQSSNDEYTAQKESFDMAAEMFKQGLINSTEFLTIKNNLITSENNQTQSKYQFLLQTEYLEYYKGESIINGQ